MQADRRTYFFSPCIQRYPCSSITQSSLTISCCHGGGLFDESSGRDADGAGALGTRARTVPPRMIQTPSQIHMTSGFRCALMMG